MTAASSLFSASEGSAVAGSVRAWTTSWLSPRDGISADFRAEWTALVAETSEPNAFAEPWFMLPSLDYLGGGRARLLAIREGERLVGLIPFAIDDEYGRIPVRHVQSWRHHHHFLGTPLIRRGSEAEVWKRVIAALDADPWCEGFLHLTNMVEDGPVLTALREAASALGRPLPVVHREERAFLHSDLSPTAYYETAVRKKKRKEIGRLRNRLAEVGDITFRRLGPDDDLDAWSSDFLAIEKRGWKGEAGSALACEHATERFFREALAGARAAGKLEILRLEVGGLTIAMLVNFRTAPGSFSFKTAFDENFARFSPGVLVQLENLAILDDPAIAWMDSCAAADHPMIDSLWMERRTIVRVTLPLAGVRRRLAYTAARTLESASAARRRFTSRKANPAQEQPE